MFEQFDAVLADGGGGVCHVDDEAVGLAAHELGRDDHPFDLRRGAPHDELTEVVVLFDADHPFHGVEAEVLDLEGVLAGGNLQFEASVGVGGHAGYLLLILHQNDRRILDGLALLVDDASVSRAESGGRSLNGADDHHDPNDPLFHGKYRVLARGRFVYTTKVCKNIYTLQCIVLIFFEKSGYIYKKGKAREKMLKKRSAVG